MNHASKGLRCQDTKCENFAFLCYDDKKCPHSVNSSLKRDKEKTPFSFLSLKGDKIINNLFLIKDV